MAGEGDAGAGAIEVRLYAELNDFLPPEKRFRSLRIPWEGKRSVKDLLESLGVPHTEIDLVLIDGEPAGWDRCVGAGNRVAAYPVFETFDVGPAERLRPEPLRHSRFVLDVHLGKLARLLRTLGFDAAYRRDATDPELAAASVAEGRILLTRDRGLLKRSQVTHGAFIRSSCPREQLVEVLRRFHLEGRAQPLSRCIECNVAIEPVAAEEIAARLPPKVRQRYSDFHRCPQCGRIYWEGTHVAAMRQWIEALGGGR